MCTYRTLPTILVGDTSFVLAPIEVFEASSGHLHQPVGLALHAPDLTPSCSPRGSWGLVPSLPLGSAALPFLGVLPDSEGTCSLACFCQKLAPKRRIGGSGTSASYSGHKLFAALDLVGSFVVPFFSSLAVLAFSALLKMLFRQMPGRNSVVGRTLHIAFAAVPTDVSKGWQVGDASRGPLIPPSHGKHSPRRCTGHRQRSSTSPSWLAAILGFSVLPVCVWAAPDGLKEALTLATSTLQSLPESFGAGDRAAKDDSPFQGWVAEILNGQACTQVAEFPFPRHCAIIQTGFPTQHLLVYTHIPCEEPAFFQAAAELGLARYKDHDLVPTLPQLSDGLASLVAAPRWLAQTDKVVVVLDFSLWHGPVYSIIDWSFTTLASLASEARKYTNAPWHVYHAQQHSPIEEGVHVNAANGDVFYFVPVGAEPLRRPRFTDMLRDARLWSSCPQVVPREIIVPVWYALMSHVTRTPTYSGTSRSELQVVAADSFHSDASDLDFEYPLEDSPLQELVYRGQLVRGVLAARLWTPSKCRPGIFAFLDTRLIGLHPTFWFGSAGWIALEHFTDILAIRIPPGFRVDPAGVPCESDRVLVSDRCTIILSFVVDEALSASLSHTDPNAGAAGRDGNSVPSNPAVDLLQNSRAARRRAGRPSPDPEALLDARTRSEETDDLTQVCFQVLVPDFQTEIVEVDLQFPCLLDDALDSVNQARRSGAAPYFDQLIPANPQPDVSFGTVIAFPAWQESQRLVLIDARLIDGRFFAVAFAGRLNRTSILLHLRTPDTPGLQVYLKGVLLDTTTWYSFGQGDTLTLLPPGFALQPLVYLADMLQGPWDWTMPCPSYPGPHFPAFCVLSDGG